MRQEEAQEVVGMLRERLAYHDDSRVEVQAKLSAKIRAIKDDLDRVEQKVNERLEEAYTAEDARLQELVYGIESECAGCRAGENNSNSSINNVDLACLVERARAALSVEQTYALEEHPDAESFAERYGLRVLRGFSGISEKRPRAVAVSFDPERGCDVVKFQFLSAEERAVLRKMGLESSVTYKALLCKKAGNKTADPEDEDEGRVDNEEVLEVNIINNEEKEEEEAVVLSESGNSTEDDEWENKEDEEKEKEVGMDLRAVLKAGATYSVRVLAECGGRASEASEAAEFTATFAECCAWRECPAGADAGIQYAVDAANPRIATKTKGDYFAMRHCTVLGSAELPRGTKDVAWGVRVLRTKGGKAAGVHVGVIPADADQCAENYLERGWFLDCHTGTLWTGRPRRTKGRAYGPRRGRGKYVKEGDAVGVVADTASGTLSFVVNGVCLGAAFTDIPLDTPLVPCVLLAAEGDSVELVGGVAAAERHSPAVPAPANLRVMGGDTWNALSVFWDAVEGGADFYQVATEGSPVWEATTACRTTREGLPPEAVACFRVRAVRGGVAGPWSDPVRGRTLRAPVAPACAWRECPAAVAQGRRYVLAPGNSRVATYAGSANADDCYDDEEEKQEGTLGCTVVGATALPQGAEKVEWAVKIASSCDDDGYGIRVGVAPVDIDKNGEGPSQDKCGWFLDCWSSTLWSGVQPKVRGRQYGPMKGKGRYVAEGDVVGVAVDTANGTVSFSINGVDLGTAFEGIPLDKPLVPCVLMCCEDDSVELI